MTETIDPVTTTYTGMDEQTQRELAVQMVEQARAAGIDLVGPGGLLTGLTKQVLETALEEELSEHLGYDKHDPVGRNRENSRNGTRTKTSSSPRQGSPAAQRIPRRQVQVCGDSVSVRSTWHRWSAVEW